MRLRKISVTVKDRIRNYSETIRREIVNYGPPNRNIIGLNQIIVRISVSKSAIVDNLRADLQIEKDVSKANATFPGVDCGLIQLDFLPTQTNAELDDCCAEERETNASVFAICAALKVVVLVD
jgi:hypothetical protein